MLTHEKLLNVLNFIVSDEKLAIAPQEIPAQPDTNVENVQPIDANQAAADVPPPEAVPPAQQEQSPPV